MGHRSPLSDVSVARITQFEGRYRGFGFLFHSMAKKGWERSGILCFVYLLLKTTRKVGREISSEFP